MTTTAETHPHGTWRRYRYTSCRCAPCLAAWTTYVELCDLRRRRGDQRLVDAGPAVDHVRALMDTYGLASWKLWPAAGVSKSMGHRLLTGKAQLLDRDRVAQVLTLAVDDLADDVCVAVQVLDEAIGRVVDARGWSYLEIERRAGLAHRFINDAHRAGRGRVTLGAVRAIEGLLGLCADDCGRDALPGGFALCLPCFQARTLPQTRREIGEHARRRHAADRRRRQRAARRAVAA